MKKSSNFVIETIKEYYVTFIILVILLALFIFIKVIQNVEEKRIFYDNDVTDVVENLNDVNRINSVNFNTEELYEFYLKYIVNLANNNFDELYNLLDNQYKGSICKVDLKELLKELAVINGNEFRIMEKYNVKGDKIYIIDSSNVEYVLKNEGIWNFKITNIHLIND